MITFLIAPENNGGNEFEIEAENIICAAVNGAWEIFKNVDRIIARVERVSGEPGCEGSFIVYEKLKDSKIESSFGHPFFVDEVKKKI